MSSWSDYKHGIITEEEYKTAYNMDPAEDHGEEYEEEEDCDE